MKSAAQLVETIRDRGGKITPQRLVIYQILEGNTSHPSAEAVYERVAAIMPTVSLTTVYKTLNELAEIGELKHFDVDGTTHFDPCTSPHAEAVCLGCGTIVDVDAVMPTSPLEDHGFRVSEVSLLFRGLCARCQADEAPGVSA